MKRILTLVVAALCGVALAAGNTDQAANTGSTTIATQSQPAPAVETDAISIPQLINYQGKLTDGAGNPVNTPQNMTFKLFAESTGGTELWSETQLSVSVANGLFNVLLGSATPVSGIPDGPNCFLEIWVGGGPISPRVRLASVPYAHDAQKADDADKLDGSHASAFAVSGHTHDASGEVTGTVTGALTIANGAVTTAKISDTAVTGTKLARGGAGTGQVLKWNGASWSPADDNVGGGGGVTNVFNGTGVVCTPNPITSSGTVAFDQTYGDGRYVNESQSAGGDLSGTYPNPTLAAIQSRAVSASAPSNGQTLVWNGSTSTWTPMIATAGNSDMVDGYHAGNASNMVAVSNGTLCSGLNADQLDGNHSSAFATSSHTHTVSGDASGTVTGTITVGGLQGRTVNATAPSTGQALTWNGSAWAPATVTAGNADMVDGYHAGNSSGQVAVSNSTLNSSLNADLLDGYTTGNSASQIPISNGTACTNLNSDLLDGNHSTAFAPASGSGNYIQNQNASYQSANWRIYGTGKCSTYTTNTPAIWGVNTGSLGIGVRGNGPGTGWGVAGYSDTAAVTGMGVIGRARNTAILGKSEYNKGVYGYALDDDGVFGYALGTTLYRYAGVNGQGGSDSTYGVKGMASAFPGVYGQNSSTRYAAVTGRNTQTAVGSAGVAGFGDTINVAAYGVSGLARYHGVYGRSKYYNGVRGEASDDNGVSGYFSGTNTSYAGVWGGRGSYGWGVYYSGGLSGSGTKSCVMRTSKGPAALYCQESPENWFEDFGSTTLTNGRAHVELDALFLETVTVDSRHPLKVFVQQTSGNPVNLVVQKGTTGFDIVGPAGSDISFDYRVVAKRKGFENLRLKVVDAGYNDPVLYPDPNDPQIPAQIRAKRLETARLEAQFGGMSPQPQPSNPTTIKKNAPVMPGLDLPPER